MKTQQVQLDDSTLLLIEVEEFDAVEQEKQQLNEQKFQELWDWMDKNDLQQQQLS